MKKFYFTVCILIVSGFLFNNLISQEKTTNKKVIVTYNWSKIQSNGSNQIAIWIEDIKGNHISTLFATHYTATGGYIQRPLSLSEWTSKFDLKNATKVEVDAITGATPQSGKQTVTWNGKDKFGNIVPEGTYIVRMEANIHDADKMFFRGEIKIGGNEQQTKGEITFSSPNLATGNVLFKDVIVEYK